ncbi:MAG: hypothetical protein R3F46_07910 [bacterium]
MRFILSTCLCLLLFTAFAFAQSEKTERVNVSAFHFSFSFEPGCVITYSEGSNGAQAIRFPKGGKTTDDPLYRVLVYGKEQYLVSLAEARDSGITPPEEQFLNTAAYPTPAAWDAQFTKIMATHGREPSGQAIVKLSDGTQRSLPYFAWSRSVGSKTHYAVMYVTIHRGAFVAVQVEGSQPFTDDSIKALTTSLELTVAPPAPAAPPAG